MSRTVYAPFCVVAAALLAACGGSSTGGSNSTNTPVAQASSSPSTAASAAPASIDPCQLVTSQEASTLAGASYGAGKEDSTQGGSKLCWYGAQTLNVFEVVVAVAPDAASAQSQWAQNQAQVQSALQQGVQNVPGMNLTFNINDTSITGADRAALGTFSATISGETISGSAVYVLKGPVFFAITDLVLGQPAPSTSALAGQAGTVLGRLP